MLFPQFLISFDEVKYFFDIIPYAKFGSIAKLNLFAFLRNLQNAQLVCERNIVYKRQSVNSFNLTLMSVNTHNFHTIVCELFD